MPNQLRLGTPCRLEVTRRFHLKGCPVKANAEHGATQAKCCTCALSPGLDAPVSFKAMSGNDRIDAGSVVGRYEIVSMLSAGGMGELYHARDPELGRDLVVKLLPRRGVFHPDAVERFVREARAASALIHPNIVTVY